MDPLSIVASIVGIISVCLRACAGLDNLRSKFENAQATIAELTSQCLLINIVLTKLETALRQRDAIRGGAELASRFDQVLQGCHAVLTRLETKVNSIQPIDGTAGARHHRFRRWRNTVAVVWNESEMWRFSHRLQVQVSSLGSLMQVLQT